ncbi:MAG: hypothetical protein PWP23_467 [Candidatus Sumerlaeota bacterium]|nr:hypothetical protein [Candidatus Sumerlaeota bacterium]
MIVLWSHVIYLAISIAVTVFVGGVLFRNGRIFLVDAFHGNEPLADSVNRLLLVGFYLVNVGFVSMALRLGAKPETSVAALEHVTTKVGAVLLILGLMHFFNVFVFSRFRKSSLNRPCNPWHSGGESDYPLPSN